MAKSLIERFWEKVDKRGPDECWSWVAGIDSRGYGQIHIGGLGTVNKKQLAHRLSYEIHNGIIERFSGNQRVCILHKCDNPVCVNPNHLFTGTHQDNSDDKISKGRIDERLGSKNANAKLNDYSVRVIKRLLGFKTLSQSTIGEAFGITGGAIGDIHRGKNWSHVGETP